MGNLRGNLKGMIDFLIAFSDDMSADWQKNWFLDGKNANLIHRDGGGLDFITYPRKFDKNENRAAFDAQHAVLWTRQEFEGDIRITYTFRVLPESGWQNLIYVQARGIGPGSFRSNGKKWSDEHPFHPTGFRQILGTE